MGDVVLGIDHAVRARSELDVGEDVRLLALGVAVVWAIPLRPAVLGAIAIAQRATTGEEHLGISHHVIVANDRVQVRRKRMYQLSSLPGSAAVVSRRAPRASELSVPQLQVLDPVQRPVSERSPVPE